MGEKEVGRVTHFFTRLGVTAVRLGEDEGCCLKPGDTIAIKKPGGTVRISEREILKIENNHSQVVSAGRNDHVGVLLLLPREKDARGIPAYVVTPRPGDRIVLVTQPAA